MCRDVNAKEKIDRVRDMLDRLLDGNCYDITSKDILEISMALDELILEYIKNNELK